MSNVFNEGDPVIVVEGANESIMAFMGKSGKIVDFCDEIAEVEFPSGRVFFLEGELAIDESRILPIPGSVFWPGQVVEVVDILYADADMLEYLGLQGVIVGAAGSIAPPSSPGQSPILDSIYDVYVKFGDDMEAFYDAELDLVEDAL